LSPALGYQLNHQEICMGYVQAPLVLEDAGRLSSRSEPQHNSLACSVAQVWLHQHRKTGHDMPPQHLVQNLKGSCIPCIPVSQVNVPAVMA
jgi:hypothetical protein